MRRDGRLRTMSTMTMIMPLKIVAVVVIATVTGSFKLGRSPSERKEKDSEPVKMSVENVIERRTQR